MKLWKILQFERKPYFLKIVIMIHWPLFFKDMQAVDNNGRIGVNLKCHGDILTFFSSLFPIQVTSLYHVKVWINFITHDKKNFVCNNDDRVNNGLKFKQIIYIGMCCCKILFCSYELIHCHCVCTAIISYFKIKYFTISYPWIVCRNVKWVV